MKGIGNTKAQFTDEVRSLRQKIVEFEARVTVGKQVEEELKAQKKFTDNVIDSLPDTFYIFDPESGKGIQWNKTLNEISGYNYEEMSEYPPLHFYPPEEHQLIEEVVKTTLEKGRAIVELNYIIADGTRIPFEYSTVLIKNAEGKPCICVIGRDITERKKAEEELRKYRDHLEELVEERTDEITKANEQLQQEIEIRKKAEGKLKESEEGYRKLIETSPDAIFVHIDQKIVFMNPSGLEILGAHNSSEVIGKSIFDFTHPDYLEMIKRRQKLLKKGEASRNEYFKAIRLDGSVIDVEATSARVTYQGKSAIISTIRDITERKQAEEKLHESEERLSVVFDKVPAVLLLVDQDRRVHLVNEAATRFARRTANEMADLRGGDALRCLHSLDDPKGCGYGPFCDICVVRNTVMETFQTSKGFYQREAQLPFDIDGETNELSLLVSTATLKVLGRQMALVCLEDITERKRAQEALREIEQRYRILIESSHEIILCKDRDGHYHTLNLKAAIGLGGTCIEDIEGKTDYDLLPKEQADALRKKDKEVMESGKDIEVEEVIRDAQRENRIYLSHKWPIYDSQGRINGITCFAMDITERKKAEEEVRMSRDYLETLTNSMWDTVFSVKMPERVIEWANDSFGLIGYAPEEYLGKTTEFLYPEKREYLAFGKKLKETIASGKVLLNTEQILRRKNGETFSAEITTTLFRDKGEIVRVTSIVRDITERKKTEQELIEYQKRLKSLASELTLAEERERSRLGIELHDQVCQTLAAAKCRLDLQRKSAASSETGKEFEEISRLLLTAIQSSRSLLFDLNPPVLHELGLEAALSDWITENIQQKCGIICEFTGEEAPKRLAKDTRSLLFRDTRELLTNVVKHAKASKIKVGISRVGNQIRICVEDNGIGFDPTESMSKSGQNKMRFGIFSIRERLEDLRGSLEIDSAPDRGCKAVITVPI